MLSCRPCSYYAAGDWQTDRPAGRALQGPPLLTAYLFMLGLALLARELPPFAARDRHHKHLRLLIQRR